MHRRRVRRRCYVRGDFLVLTIGRSSELLHRRYESLLSCPVPWLPGGWCPRRQKRWSDQIVDRAEIGWCAVLWPSRVLSCAASAWPSEAAMPAHASRQRPQLLPECTPLRESCRRASRCDRIFRRVWVPSWSESSFVFTLVLARQLQVV